MTSADARRFRSACECLEEADGLKVLPGRALVVLGLCYVTAGDVARAASTWARVPDDSSVHSRATHLLQMIQSDEVAEAFEAYARALANAREGKLSEALLQVRLCRATLPDLISAARLELLLTPAGDKQRELALTLLKQFPDDTELLALVGRAVGASSLLREDSREIPRPTKRDAQRRGLGGYLVIALAGVGLGALGTLALRGPASQPLRVVVDSSSTVVRGQQTPAPMTTPNNATERAALELSLSDRASDLAKLREVLLAEPRGYSTAQIAALERRLDQAARQAYSTGLQTLRGGDTVAAIAALREAGTASVRSYHTDDALYLLALLLDTRGETDEASGAATQLLEQHPNSMYRNSTTQRIASRRTARTP